MLIDIYVRASLVQLGKMQVLYSRGFLLYLCSTQKKKTLFLKALPKMNTKQANNTRKKLTQ